MKRLILVIFVVVILLSSISCGIKTRQDLVVESLGKYKSEQLWTHGMFQDHADFGIYSYSSPNIDQNKYFTQVSASDIITINSFIDDYEEWIRTFEKNDPDDELVVNYAFDRTIMDTEDYFYIRLEYEDEPYWNYDVWVFDSQTKTLYYFHTNI